MDFDSLGGAAAMATQDMAKEQLVDQAPKRLKELRFGLGSSQDILKQGVLEVCDRVYRDITRGHIPVKNGVLDPRMGIASKQDYCQTCGESMTKCNGHFGYIKLALPVFHVGFLKATIWMLQDICKECSSILLTEAERRTYLKSIRRPNLDDVQKKRIWKKVNQQCRKVRSCYACGALNGRVRKAGHGPLKFVHERFSAFDQSKSKSKVPPKEKTEFDKSFAHVRQAHADVERNMKKAVDDMNPIKVLNLFKRIISTDCELLGMNPEEGRPEMMIWQYFPVSPVSIRPSVPTDSGATEDDITSKTADIVSYNNLIRENLRIGAPLSTIMDSWDHLQLQVATIVHSEMPGVQPTQYQSAAIKGFCQRLKGKQGRFRANLSGKRVNFSGRTVISPDPNLGINEVAVPIHVAMNLTFPERVNRYNIEKLRKRIMNGYHVWPGVNNIFKKGKKLRLYTKFLSIEQKVRHAQNLAIGDEVERHLEDGDTVLFNRQPSLHKLSMMAHRVKVRPDRTFRINECVCTPYNADFDGDEMNIHVPQTEEARAEANELMNVKNNLATPRNGEPIVAAIQDFVTAAYLLSNKDIFYDRKTFSHICMYMVEGNMQIDLPPPTILKPVTLWTGKQIFNVLMRPNKSHKIFVNLDAPCREFRMNPDDKFHRDLNAKDSWLCIRNSEVMCGVMDKSIIGAGKKDSLFHVILRDYGADVALHAMNRLARLCSRWLTEQGFSIGIGDVRPSENLQTSKQILVAKAYATCDELISAFKNQKLAKGAGLNEEQTLEASISGILTKVRSQAGEMCFAELSKANPPMVMAVCGSKGSGINVAQMVATVGQQIIDQARPTNGFLDRTLPHFPKTARQPPSKGFVRNSFYSGLSPSELFFHAMSGREGLVDTAVKTAETGYMSRRLMKSLEDLSVQYDQTVRISNGTIVQFQYGDDKLDPINMEMKARPVNFERTFKHAEATTWKSTDRGLLPWEIQKITKTSVNEIKAPLARRNLKGKELEYNDQSLNNTDEKEAAREFIESIEAFMGRKSHEIATLREKVKLPNELEEGVRLNRKRQAKGIKEFLDCTAKVSEATLRTFVDSCLRKYEKAEVEPGTAIGAIGAQSIGEPGTQMTLKTFHFAGVANMHITQGVPRIKEIINASHKISTPIITCNLDNKNDTIAARVVKGRIEQTFLRDIIEYIEDVWSASCSYVAFKVDFHTVGKLQLDLNMADIVSLLTKNKKLRLSPLSIRCWRSYLRINVKHVEKGKRSKADSNRADTNKTAYAKSSSEERETFLRVQDLKRALPDVLICGYPGASRAVIKTSGDMEENALLVEGYGLRACMTTQGVDGAHTRTNNIMEVKDVLGIEAARTTIINEVDSVMGDMDIDPRHLQLLADTMTYKGEVLGITRFGLAKMRDSVLQLASFEKTPDHLFDAAWHGKTDKVEGVSECIIMGQSVGLGTGALKVVRRLAIEDGIVGKKPTLFEDTWQKLTAKRKEARH